MAGNERCRGPGPALTQGIKELRAEQTASGAGIAAIKAVVQVQQPEVFGFRHTAVHPDSTGANAGVRHIGAGLVQRVAAYIQRQVFFSQYTHLCT